MTTMQALAHSVNRIYALVAEHQSPRDGGRSEHALRLCVRRRQRDRRDHVASFRVGTMVCGMRVFRVQAGTALALHAQYLDDAQRTAGEKACASHAELRGDHRLRRRRVRAPFDHQAFGGPSGADTLHVMDDRCRVALVRVGSASDTCCRPCNIGSLVITWAIAASSWAVRRPATMRSSIARNTRLTERPASALRAQALSIRRQARRGKRGRAYSAPGSPRRAARTVAEPPIPRAGSKGPTPTATRSATQTRGSQCRNAVVFAPRSAAHGRRGAGDTTRTSLSDPSYPP